MNNISIRTDKSLELKCVERVFLAKIDLFMEHHVIPFCNPNDIYWWFSVSGGKDSFAMVNGIQKWYDAHKICLNSTVFHIDQWGGPAATSIEKYFEGYNLRIINGQLLTRRTIQYEYGQQAPCRQCADVRRNLNDIVIQRESRRNGKINFIARGLHLSDMATSLFWRYVMLENPLEAMLTSEKGRPVSKLWSNTFLAKPLSYVREFEAQRYAMSIGYKPVCCGCPACKFPSRRDIVEETLLQYHRSQLWEFTIPGVNEFLCYWADQETMSKAQHLSVPGVEAKKSHLPKDFGDFAVEYFREAIGTSLYRESLSLFDDCLDLDDIGKKRLQQHHPLIDVRKIPLPAILNSRRKISDLEALMIGTLGPFWGAIGLTPVMSKKVFLFQERLLGITIDDKWSQVNDIVNKYYGGGNVSQQRKAELVVRNNNCLSHCLCSL